MIFDPNYDTSGIFKIRFKDAPLAAMDIRAMADHYMGHHGFISPMPDVFVDYTQVIVDFNNFKMKINDAYMSPVIIEQINSLRFAMRASNPRSLHQTNDGYYICINQQEIDYLGRNIRDGKFYSQYSIEQLFTEFGFTRVNFLHIESVKMSHIDWANWLESYDDIFKADNIDDFWGHVSECDSLTADTMHFVENVADYVVRDCNKVSTNINRHSACRIINEIVIPKKFPKRKKF